MNYRFFKIAGLVVVVLMIGFLAVFWFAMRPIWAFTSGPTPQLVTANPVDLAGTYMISKFRSAAGHDYSHGALGGETCRSMKHYFNTSRNNTADHRPIRSTPTPTEPNITIYAPFDGTVSKAEPEHIGTQVHVRSAHYPGYYVRLFHIDLMPGLKVGSKVSSGQPVGTIGPKDGTDVSVEANLLPPGKTLYLSLYEVMTDEAFAPLAAQGFQRSDFIISQAKRDAQPLRCGNQNEKERFIHDQNYHWQDDFIHLKADPYSQEGHPIHIGPPIR